MTDAEGEELVRLRKENKRLTMERDILKKGQCLLCARSSVRYLFIEQQSAVWPITDLCRVMRVSRSAYYAWLRRPAHIIDEQTLVLYRRVKALFKASRASMGSRQMVKQ